MTIGALIRPTMNCSRAVLWSWLGARTTRSKEPLRRSAIRLGFFLGLASGHSLWISCVLKSTAAYWIPVPEVLPFAEQLHEANVQRVLDAGG